MVCDGDYDRVRRVVDDDCCAAIGDCVNISGGAPNILALELGVYKSERLAFIVQGVQVSLLNEYFVLFVRRRRNLAYRFHVKTSEPQQVLLRQSVVFTLKLHALIEMIERL